MRLIGSQIIPNKATAEALYITRTVLSEICESLQRLNATGSLDRIFETDSFNRLVAAALQLPEVFTVVVESFLKEDLHRFLLENQLGSIISTFPAAFCGNDSIWDYFRRSKGSETLRLTLCTLDIANLTRDFEQEFLAQNQKPMMMSMSANDHFDGLVESVGCIIDTALVLQWERLVDILPLMKGVGMIGGYADGKEFNAW